MTSKGDFHTSGIRFSFGGYRCDVYRPDSLGISNICTSILVSPRIYVVITRAIAGDSVAEGSQFSYPADMDPEEKVRLIAAQLRDYYGPIEVQWTNPVEELVTTILSQNTNDTNSDRAYHSLMERFGSLAAVKDAPAEEIEEAIKIGGLHRQKAARIKQVLGRIEQERGALDLSFLGDLPLKEALDWLLASPGVGNKTAGIVLLFSFGKPYFPVDTHIKRVTKRLGLVTRNEVPHARMNAMLPKDPHFMICLHLQLIRLGRELCHPRNPVCVHCPLNDLCSYNAGPVLQRRVYH